MILVNSIFFYDKLFEESELLFWLFDNGLTEYTNEEIHRAKIAGIYSRKINY